MALPVIASCTPVARVFDCMDELSAFRFAPSELRARDRATMRWAEVVFTGGRSLYEARRHQHLNLYCIPSSVAAIDPDRKTVTLSTGDIIGYDHLIVTAPLPVIVELLTKAPADVRAAARGLRSVSVRCVNIGIDRPHMTEKHWIYYPEDTMFHRIFVQSNASALCTPPDCSSFAAEISYSAHKPLPCEGSALIELVIGDAQRVGMLQPDDRILAANQIDLPYENLGVPSGAYAAHTRGASDLVLYPFSASGAVETGRDVILLEWLILQCVR